MIHETLVKTIKMTLLCDSCGSEMKPTGLELQSIPPQYPHTCPKCGKSENISGKKYPYMKYVPLEEK